MNRINRIELIFTIKMGKISIIITYNLCMYNIHIYILVYIDIKAKINSINL